MNITDQGVLSSESQNMLRYINKKNDDNNRQRTRAQIIKKKEK